MYIDGVKRNDLLEKYLGRLFIPMFFTTTEKIVFEKS